MCGAYGWISETAVSAAKRAAGSSGARASSLTSSITAAIGVLKAKRRSMSSVTFAIVRCALRASGASTARRRVGCSACSPHDPPQPVQEPPDAVDPRSVPLHVLVGRAHEERVRAARRRRRSARRTSSGSTTLPFDLDIFAPPVVIIPWLNRRANGSRKPTRPMSCSTFVKKRAYSRCRIACSMPPMYWLTGSQ